MDTLLTCVPHYIRCVKPNDFKKAGEVNEERIRHQVRYLGLVENVRVRRAGFCFRLPYERFEWRYKMTCKETWPLNKKPAKDNTKTLLHFHNVTNDNEFRFGQTKIFLRNPTTLFYLEEQREKALPMVVTVLAKRWKGFKARKLLKRMKSCIMIQKVSKLVVVDTMDHCFGFAANLAAKTKQWSIVSTTTFVISIINYDCLSLRCGEDSNKEENSWGTRINWKPKRRRKRRTERNVSQAQKPYISIEKSRYTCRRDSRLSQRPLVTLYSFEDGWRCCTRRTLWHWQSSCMESTSRGPRRPPSAHLLVLWWNSSPRYCKPHTPNGEQSKWSSRFSLQKKSIKWDKRWPPTIFSMERSLGCTHTRMQIHCFFSSQILQDLAWKKAVNLHSCSSISHSFSRFTRKYESDYLEMNSNPGKDKYIAGMKRLFAKYGDTRVLFADYGT